MLPEGAAAAACAAARRGPRSPGCCGSCPWPGALGRGRGRRAGRLAAGGRRARGGCSGSSGRGAVSGSVRARAAQPSGATTRRRRAPKPPARIASRPHDLLESAGGPHLSIGPRKNPPAGKMRAHPKESRCSRNKPDRPRPPACPQPPHPFRRDRLEPSARLPPGRRAHPGRRRAGRPSSPGSPTWPNVLQEIPARQLARSEKEILESDDIQLIASAAIPDERAPLGIEAMRHGKDFLSDKPGMTTPAAAGRGPPRAGPDPPDLLDHVQRAAREPGHREGGRAGQGRAPSARWSTSSASGPHRLNLKTRPALVLQEGALRRRPVRSRLAPVRPVPVPDRLDAGRDRGRPGGEPAPPRARPASRTSAR